MHGLCPSSMLEATFSAHFMGHIRGSMVICDSTLFGYSG